MPRPISNPTTLPLPPQPDFDLWPRNITSQQAALLVSHYFGPQSARTIREHWPLVWTDFGGRGVTPAVGVFAVAQHRLDAGARSVNHNPCGVEQQEAA